MVRSCAEEHWFPHVYEPLSVAVRYLIHEMIAAKNYEPVIVVEANKISRQ